ncbi:PREDICTED: EH domain-binding protein 1-like protein 1 isoform X2 [Papilio xuthus]|uniref:EH domain-binding protein 1-like protein 1 isoform X2 n=1 Tax=Papilio xuthus TaxID=66420 RepID=A0AAJ6ZSX5_PAPXU|nr:PREDICTED: EH domain-binding protein 1-like protein 1 isoform X2 [Papilio xuthus]
MASVWKRLQRVNKRAAKFQYTASYHRIDVETTPKWKPNKLSIVWTRRSRRVVTEPVEWEPSLKDPLKGSVIFTVPENQTVTVTLFRDPRTNELEDKDWTFVLEDVSPTGKRRRLAAAALDLRKHASLAAAQRAVRVQLDPTGRRLRAASLHLTLHSVLLREGHATDEDMQSLASLLSVNNNSDIAVLEDLDEDDYTLSDNSTRQMLDLRQQMEEMTQSLTNSDIAATPNSVQSLNFDNSATPTAPITPTTDTPTNPATPTSPATPTPNNKDIDFTQKETNIKRPEYNFTKMTIKTEPPKFTSTPKAEEPTLDNFKAMQFKPKTIAKKNLKPLELKSNLNNISLDTNENEKGGDSEKTPVVDMEKLFPLKNLDKDKTPVQDLLEWCQSVTREYRACRITNLTTSFRSGLAFCAIIHRFRPDLIDFSGLQPEEAERNLRVALEASARLGISQVLSAADVCAPPAPDKLAIMTYLFQLRAHFTGSELQVEQLGNDETESSYLVGRHDTDGAVPRDLFSREVSERRSRMRTRPRPNSQDSDTKSQERSSPEKAQSPAAMKEVRDMLVHQSKTILGKMLSPARDLKTSQPNTKWFADPPTLPEAIPARPEKLMTRKELTDPFGSDEEEEPAPPPAQETISTDTVKAESKPTIEPAVTDPLTSAHEASPPPQTSPQQEDQAAVPDLPKPTPQLLSRHDELKERARQLLEATKREAREKEKNRRQNSKEKEEANKTEMVNGLRNGDASPVKKPMTEEERQAMLRERARKLIADARAGIVSPTSPLSPSRSRGTVEIISKQSVMEELAAAGGVEQLEALAARGDTPPTPGSRSYGSADRSEERESESRSMSPGGGARRSPLHSFSALVDRLAPADAAPDEGKESGSYIASELEALEREQSAVDERAAALEKQLRRVMESADNTEEEDRLMSQWFHLVNKKNALLRRQMQLNILEQEEDLSRRCELLARELRLSLAVDEWRKTPGQKRRERLLLQELLSAVNERDRLVQEMDEQEKAIAEDDEIERNLSNVEIQRKNNCILQ